MDGELDGGLEVLDELDELDEESDDEVVDDGVVEDESDPLDELEPESPAGLVVVLDELFEPRESLR